MQKKSTAKTLSSLMKFRSVELYSISGGKLLSISQVTLLAIFCETNFNTSTLFWESQTKDVGDDFL